MKRFDEANCLSIFWLLEIPLGDLSRFGENFGAFRHQSFSLLWTWWIVHTSQPVLMPEWLIGIEEVAISNTTCHNH